MGVYVFQSKHAAAIKVGHYSRKNAWSRVAHRGFNSCLCPKDLIGRVAVDDLELLYWFPELTTKDEKRMHRLLSEFALIGEWFSVAALDVVKSWAYENRFGECDRAAACASRRRL